MRSRLDVFFRGERDYVQGSLLLSQAVEACAAATPPGAPRPEAITRADFRAITRAHCLVTDERPGPGDAPCAKIRVRCEDGSRRTLHVLEDPGRPEPPPRVADRPPLVARFEATEGGGARLALHPLACLDDLTAALVQTGRRVYAELFPGARSPWILSFYDLALPVDPAPFARGARVTTACEGRRTAGPRTVTTHRLWLEGEGAPPLSLRMLGACEPVG
jgi:hypothetical protein